MEFLETALQYREVFYRLMQREQNYRKLPKGLPKEEDWSWASEIYDKLKLFYIATEMFSGTKYATANLCFPKICEIKLVLTQWTLSLNEIISTMAKNMLLKFGKYWDVKHGIMTVACVLDRRHKMCLLENFCEKIYRRERYEDEMEKIQKICYELLHEYQQKSSANTGVGSSNISSSSQSKFIDSGEALQDYDLYVGLKKRKRAYVKSELDHYLEEEVLPREASFDILAWWKSNGIKYPTLQMIARDIYAIPVSTIASESTFSMDGRLVSPHRSRLHPKTMEVLACAQSWLWADIEGMSFGALGDT